MKNSALRVNVLKLTLHGQLVGYLSGFQDGRNVLTFAEKFKSDPHRPVFSLITSQGFPRADKILQNPWVRNLRLHPILSNLLPEGVLREYMAQGLKVHIDDEFHIFAYLGQDLPGALIAEAMAPDDVPESAIPERENVKVEIAPRPEQLQKFSLAGVQMKFSMKEQDGRFNLSNEGTLGDWIVKTPSTKHKDVPVNEYTAMTLASSAGIEIPEIKLVPMENLDNLPSINLPGEKLAFAIKRFDRNNGMRIHMEDFAQILVKYPHEKYNSANYEMLARIMYQFSGDGLADVQQFARRLLVNILLANGDAHLKNWSLLYPDQRTPRLSPAYDILTTQVYIKDEKLLALNLGKTKQWYNASYANFELWAKHADLPWRAIRPHLDDTMARARDLWPRMLKDLPMDETHKEELKRHWEKLHKDFRIVT
jgi:serine/threonine-protein kinase HipA